MTDLKQKILAAAETDLDDIETALAENLTPHVDLVKAIAGHILFSGGKRLRPLLMLLSARICGRDDAFCKKFSVIFEYLHAATLLHDDVVDGARVRRSRPAAHTVWDSAVAVLTGDFLLARALAIAAEAESPAIIRTVSWVTENMSQGEIHQLSRKADLSLSEADYLEVIRCKTAVLFQGACRSSAQLAAAPPDTEQALADYGHHLGMAFQMADDLLDYEADSATLGKTAGADLREGKLTLPVIRTLAVAGEQDRQFISAVIQNPDFSETEFRRLHRIMVETGAIAYTRAAAERHVAAAIAALAGFPASATLGMLRDIARYALVRGA